MGVYLRADSPFYWMALRRPGRPSLRESTGVLHDAPTKWQRDKQRQSAEEIFARRVEELARGRHQLPEDLPEITFEAFAAWYAEHKVPTHRGAERDRELLAVLVGFFGRYPLRQITDDLVSEYETRRTGKDGRRPSTANREVDLLKTVLAAAVPKYLDASPIAGRRRLRTVKIRKRVIGDAGEEARLLEQLAPRDQVLYLACVDTLARLGDILDLKRTDDQRTFLDFLDSKTGPYTVPVSARLRAALDSLPVEPLEKDRPYYFWWRRRAATERDRRGAVRQMLKKAAERAGIPYGRAVGGITWHTGTRATGATRMLRAGVDPATVQSVGHWASLQQMSEYLSTTTPLQQAAVEQIGQHTDLAALQAAGEAARQARAARSHQSPRERHVNGSGRKGAESRGKSQAPPETGPQRSRGKILKFG